MMIDTCQVHDKIIAKVQYFYDMLRQVENEKQALLMIFSSDESCEKEKIKQQIDTLEQMQEDFFNLFHDILYR